jgi:hypothetical protein
MHNNPKKAMPEVLRRLREEIDERCSDWADDPTPTAVSRARLAEAKVALGLIDRAAAKVAQ